METMKMRPETVERRRTLYREAAALVQEEYATKLTLHSVSRRIATSPRQLQRAFAEAGTSFSDYLTDVRMDRAATLLRAGRPVHEVSHAVGYRQPGQFAKTFRRRHGSSPSHAASSTPLPSVK
jgi:AraC family transcriptional regulator, regulatory protein of adaptative response / methylphosphotriester-DNA alkyltransferase methyltransferase